MNGRKIYHARGKVLGGSSSINGMIFQRGNPLDYERWAADPGMETWDYAHCLPYFKKMENCLAPAARPVPRRQRAAGAGARPGDQSRCSTAFFEAVQQAGYPHHRRRQRLPAGGLRQVRPQHSPRSPAERGTRLPAPGHATARTSPSPPAPWCTGCCSTARVRPASSTASRGRRHTAGDAGEVILCGGAFNSPQLLQLSGVGDADELGDARHPRRARPAGGRRAHAGPPRGLRAVLVQAAGVVAAVS